MMKRMKFSFLMILVVPTILWLLADTLYPEPFTYFAFRKVFIQYSGVLAIILMSIVMILALRPKFIEPYFDGIDKIYKLHKWLGISAFLLGVLHWWFAKGTKWMVGWGWLEKPVKTPSNEVLGVIEAWFKIQKGLSESIGEWAFYIMVILIFIALIKKIPYHWFVKSHKIFALVYIALVYHTIILTKIGYWSEPIGLLLIVMIVFGTIAAFISLFKKIGNSRKSQAKIVDLVEYPKLKILETTLLLDDTWKGHKAGQFAFVTSNKKEGHHPYTIASSWDKNDKKMTFITKALGDHTSRLKDTLKIGMNVEVEGPYGCFDFGDDKKLHIYIGAGIGVTPFIARMNDLEKNPNDKTIHFFHSTSKPDDEFLENLKEDVKNSNVNLHLFVSKIDERLSSEKIKELVPNWQNSSIWYCGPLKFGQSLREDFVSSGLNPEDFHQELFEMR